NDPRLLLGRRAATRLVPPPAIGAKELLRVVLDAEHVTPEELLAPDERIPSAFESEPEEVRRRDELRLDGLANRIGDGRGLVEVRQRVGGLSGALRAAALARPLLLQERVLGLAAIRLADGDAISLDRTADEEALAREPDV